MKIQKIDKIPEITNPYLKETSKVMDILSKMEVDDVLKISFEDEEDRLKEVMTMFIYNTALTATACKLECDGLKLFTLEKSDTTLYARRDA